jgi:hypothetical protein
VHVARFLPASIRRAFSLMWMRARHLFDATPVLFFGVVIGVALAFRLAVGWGHALATPEVVAPTWPVANVTGPEPGIAPTPSPSPSTTAEVGAAAKVQPIGLPSPPRVAPKPRGHGRRPVR